MLQPVRPFFLFMDSEVWLPIQVALGRYEISSIGNHRVVYSLSKLGKRRELFTGQNLKPQMHNNRPYLKCCIPTFKKGHWARRKWFIHQLVALAFVPNPDNKPQVNHIDANMQNNHYTNLEWVTNKENSEHAQRLGLMNIAKPKQRKNRYQIRRKKVINTLTNQVFDSAKVVSELYDISEKQLLKKLRAERSNNTPFKYEGSYSKKIIARKSE